MGSHPKADPELVEVFDTEQESGPWWCTAS
jgi:hypothetical protein